MHIENLQEGDKVCILRNDLYEAQSDGMPTLYRGEPMMVVAISAPFVSVVAVSDPMTVVGVDTRVIKLTKVTKEYWDGHKFSYRDIWDEAARIYDEEQGCEEEEELEVNPQPLTSSKVTVIRQCPICEEGRFIQRYQKTGECTISCNCCGAEVTRKKAKSPTK